MVRPSLCFPFIKGDFGNPIPPTRKRSKQFWDYIPRFFSGVTLSLILVLISPSVSRAETTPSSELESILQKIESRHYRWIAIRANVLLFFAKDGDPSAMCAGELLYQRLDERMFLTCADAKQELLFVFRTFDRRFDLYLPGQNTVYHGSIFDMEDSPDIESHLKARDLYRALKPTAVDPRRAKIERTNSAITSLNVFGQNDRAEELIRKMYLTPEGDVRGELFFGVKGHSVTEIQRYDFRELKSRAGLRGPIIFPKKITIMSPETKKGSAIFFTQVTAQDTIDPLEFILRVPPGTKEIFLDREDPRSQPTPKSQNEALRDLRPKRPSLANPSPKIKSPKPSLDSSEVSKKTVVAAPEEKHEKNPLSVPTKEEAVKSELLSVRKESTPSSEKTSPAQNPDADIATEESSSPAPGSSTDPQTTLDPSVAPSLEMGRS